MNEKKPVRKHQWLLNWNLLTIIVGITLVLEVVVVIVFHYLHEKRITILGLSIAIAVLAFLAYFSHGRQRKVLLALQGIEPLRFKHAGSHLNLILTIIISGSIFVGVSYVISYYTKMPLYFSLAWIVFGVMLTVTKNVTSHEILGRTLLIRVSFIELFIPISNIESIWADDNRLPDIPKNLKLPRRYRAVSSYFGYRIYITLKEPQKAFVLGFPPIRKTKEILFDVDEPKKFVTAILDRAPSLKGIKRPN